MHYRKVPHRFAVMRKEIGKGAQPPYLIFASFFQETTYVFISGLE